MGRLYQDPIQVPGLQKGKKQNKENLKNYLEKVATIIPSEIIAAYLTLVGLVPLIRKADLHQWFYYVVFGVGVVFTPVYFSLQADEGKPKKMHIFLSTLSFVIWAYHTTGDKIFPNYYDSAIASIILIVFSLAFGKIPLK